MFLSELALAFQYVDAELPPESPYLYGLHPNAEIGFLTQTSEKLFRTVLELQPRDSQAGDGAGPTREEKVYGGHCLRSLWGAENCRWRVLFHGSHCRFTAQTTPCIPSSHVPARPAWTCLPFNSRSLFPLPVMSPHWPSGYIIGSPCHWQFALLVHPKSIFIQFVCQSEERSGLNNSGLGSLKLTL